MQTLKVYPYKPVDFKPQVEVAATYLQFNGKILFLQISKEKKEAGTWGVPCGKLESGESAEMGAKRELFEETGISVDRLQSLGALYIRKPNIDYTYHLFTAVLDTLPQVKLAPREHQQFVWTDNALTLPLMAGAKEALDAFLQRFYTGSRPGHFINAHLVLQKDDQILLSYRQNTGFNDNLYGLVAGHVEHGESATQAMIREAFEEAGIIIHPTDLKLVYTTHRKTNRSNIDLFFTCKRWEGPIRNAEPHKCGGLQFFPKNDLPNNTIEYIVLALQDISKGHIYSESGY